MTENFKSRNLNKFYEETELISSPYYKKDNSSQILVASDIHYHENVDKQLYKLLVNHCREVQPDFIVLPGDMVETSSFLDSTKEKEFFETIIKQMAEVAPVIIVLGNHELANFDVKNFLSGKRESTTKIANFFESLNRFKNVYFLNNEQTTINGMTFLGFSPRLATYLKNNEETNAMFIEDYLKSGLKMAESQYNILLTHSPLLLNQKNVFNSVSDFEKLTDLVISGHFHDGYLPKAFDKIVGKSNAGLFFTPLVFPIPGLICRGVHNFGRGYLFVSQGFRKWTADNALCNAFEKITANDVERLIITSPDIVIDSNSKGFHR